MSRMNGASQASIEARQARAKLKQKARTGQVTFSEVLIGHVEIVGPLRLADVAGWKWPRMGEARQIKLGKLAAREGLNLLLPTMRASWTTRHRFAELMWEVREAQQTTVLEAVGVDRDEDIKRLKWLLAKTEAERDAAQEKAEGLERHIRGCQLTMPTVQAERMLAELADAVEEHRRTVEGPSHPEKWAVADESLWARKNQILESDSVLRSAA